MDASAQFFRDVLAGDAAQVATLLEREPHLVHARSPDGLTALHLAVRDGYRDVVATLLARGADVNAPAFRRLARFPLVVAVLMNRVEIAGLLLDFGADIEIPDAMGRRPLHLAALDGRSDMVRVLLAHGADVNAVDNTLSTPLALAREWGHAEVAALLQGADREDGGYQLVARLVW
jgi:ankyrin repeat protein